MTFLHQNQQSAAADGPRAISANAADSATSSNSSQGKRRMSLFSFGLGSSNQNSAQSKNKNLPALSTSPSSSSTSQAAVLQKSPVVRSPNTSYGSRPNQSVSPGITSVSETDSLSENPDSHIFERSVQDMAGSVKQEDYIPPALDATAQILSDSATDLDNVEMVYSSRRNSSVIGLNMALGRPSPSRKNSVYSMSHLNNSHNNQNNTLASSSSLTYSQPQPFQSSSQPTSSGSQQAQSPVSPPKLMSSRSSVSFYSYADMISNDEFSRRPSLMQAYSHGVVPTIGRKLSVASNHSNASNTFNGTRERSASELGKFPRKISQTDATSPDTQSQLSKQFRDRSKSVQPMTKLNNTLGESKVESSPSKKFLISPESSDSEEKDEIFHPASSFNRRPMSRRRSVASNSSFANSVAENESFVSSSVGDCIRRCTTEIENN